MDAASSADDDLFSSKTVFGIVNNLQVTQPLDGGGGGGGAAAGAAAVGLFFPFACHLTVRCHRAHHLT